VATYHPVDRAWGEREDLAQSLSLAIGNWRMRLTGHGIEDVAYRGDVLARRVFFSVRDQSWASPAVPMTYRRHAGVDLDGVGSLYDMVGAVDGYPLRISGSVAVTDRAVTVAYHLGVGADVEVSRCGPCVLHDVPPPGQVIATDRPGPEGRFTVGSGIPAHPLASGYHKLAYAVGATNLTVDFEGAAFEMEDQRNWADSTLKSYCPPLSDPRPLQLEAGRVVAFSVRLTAEAASRRRGPGGHPSPRRRSVWRAPRRGSSFALALPALGLSHPGGDLAVDVVDRLSAVRPAFLHLLVELGDDDWARRMEADLRVADSLGVGAVVTVDCPPDRLGQLRRMAGHSRGVIDTAFLFGSGSALTSAELAETGRSLFEGTGVRVGAGTRGHFASLNSAGHVPDAAEVVAVALAAGAHDDDRRALATGIDSYGHIVDQLRHLATGRELYIGPVGFAPTFDSWSPVGAQRAVREAWAGDHPRQPSAFAAAWTIAAVAALVPLAVPRVCIAGTVGGRGVGDVTGGEFRPYPVLSALRVLADMGTGPIGAARPSDRLAALYGEGPTVVAIMTDDPVDFSAPGPVTVWRWSAGSFVAESARGPRPSLPTPSIAVAHPDVVLRIDDGGAAVETGADK
jgi:D-apionolactonase